MKFSKTKIIMAAMLAALGMTQQAVAHDQIGTLLLGSGTKATDYYVATCASDPNLGGGVAADRLYFQIKDNSAGGNAVGMTVISNNGPLNAKAATTIDGTGGDPVFSPAETMAGGNGQYLITVFHTGNPATESYTFTFHCETVGGVHTGTSIVRQSNQ